MRIGVERFAGRCVAESRLNHIYVFAMTDEQGRIEVAQVVEGGPLGKTINAPNLPIPDLCPPVPMHRGSASGLEHQPFKPATELPKLLRQSDLVSRNEAFVGREEGGEAVGIGHLALQPENSVNSFVERGMRLDQHRVHSQRCVVRCKAPLRV